MTTNECFNLGYITRRVGNKGELAFVLDVDDPSKYKKLDSVFIEINHSLVPFFIKQIQLRGNIATVALEGIDSIVKAEELLKSALYLPLDLLSKLSGKKFYLHEMPGFRVFDKVYGEIGVLERVLEYPQQLIFQVKRGNKEILIPAREEFIVSIDRTTKQLHLQTPEGLIDIYISEQKSEESEKETDID